MGKLTIVLMAIGVLAFSTILTDTRRDQIERGQAIGSAALGDTSGAVSPLLGRVDRASEPGAPPAPGLRLRESGAQSDGPAMALLVYLGCILIGSAVGVGWARRSRRA